MDIVIQHEERLDEIPKILKSHKIYLNNDGDIVTSYFVELLFNERILKEDVSLAFFN